ncbi:MAG: septal ring lytic transglycosylase RlpA family protein [Alphaproteobacteria bacterium]
MTRRKTAIARIGRGTGVAMAALLLGACAQTELAIHTAKQINEKTHADQPRRVGDYKIGSPYQINGVWYYPKEDYGFSETGVASWYGPQFHGKATANGETFDMNELTAAHRTLQMPAVVRVTNLENGRSVLLRVNDRGPFARNRVIDISRRGAQLLGFMEKGTALVKIEVMAEESRVAALDAQRRMQVAALPASGRVPVKVEPLVETTPVPPVTEAAEPSPVQQFQKKVAVTARPETLPRPPVKAQPQTQPPRPVAAKPAGKPAPARPAAVARTEIAKAPPAISGPAMSGEVRQAAMRGEPRMYVQVGSFADRTKADKLRSQLVELGPTNISQAQLSGQRFYRVRVGPVGTVEQADRVLDAVIDAGHPTARVVID